MKTKPFSELIEPIISALSDNKVFIDHNFNAEASEYIYTFQSNTTFILYVDDFMSANTTDNRRGNITVQIKNYSTYLARTNILNPIKFTVDIYIGKIGTALYLNLVPNQKGISIRIKTERLRASDVTPTLVTSQIDTSSFVKIN